MTPQEEVLNVIKKLGKARCIDITRTNGRAYSRNSYILRILYAKGLLDRERQGMSVYYSVKEKA